MLFNLQICYNIFNGCIAYFNIGWCLWSTLSWLVRALIKNRFFNGRFPLTKNPSFTVFSLDPFDARFWYTKSEIIKKLEGMKMCRKDSTFSLSRISNDDKKPLVALLSGTICQNGFRCSRRRTCQTHLLEQKPQKLNNFSFCPSHQAVSQLLSRQLLKASILKKY